MIDGAQGRLSSTHDMTDRLVIPQLPVMPQQQPFTPHQQITPQQPVIPQQTFTPQQPFTPQQAQQPITPQRLIAPQRPAYPAPCRPPAPDWNSTQTVPQSNPKEAKRSRSRCAAVVATALISAVVGGGAGMAGAYFLPVHADAAVAISAANGSTTRSASAGSIEQAAAKALPSVVQLQVKVGPQAMLGSGIILTPDGLIMTNYHVVAGPGGTGEKQNVVTLGDGRTAPFTVVGTDPILDIAVVRIQGVSGLTPISFGSSGNLHVGQQVVAVGSPQGIQSTVTSGIISALHRPFTASLEGTNEQVLYEAIQTDAALNPGNSGGALIDLNGELVGVSSGGVPGSTGLGFAIPADQAKRVSDELIATGHAKHASLGVQVAVDSAVNGAEIKAVTGGGAAAGAGLPAGSVVTKLDDQSITSAPALAAAIRSKAPGTTVTVTYVDASASTKTVNITLGLDQGKQSLKATDTQIAA